MVTNLHGDKLSGYPNHWSGLRSRTSSVVGFMLGKQDLAGTDWRSCD